MRKLFLLLCGLVIAVGVASAKEPKQKQTSHARDILARARAANRVRIIKAQVPNSDCGEVWVEFFRCVADPQCAPGQKFCTFVFNSEFCGTWDTRSCWP